MVTSVHLIDIIIDINILFYLMSQKWTRETKATGSFENWRGKVRYENYKLKKSNFNKSDYTGIIFAGVTLQQQQQQHCTRIYLY